MTHTLHRLGDTQDLRDDFVLLCTPAIGRNHQGARDKLLQVLDIVLEAEPANIGFYGHGAALFDLDMDQVRRDMTDTSRIRCCFDSLEKLKQALEALIQADTGLSITVSGLLDEVVDLARELNLTPHSVNISCGVFGATHKLDPPETMALTTMCGHHMISHTLVAAVRQRLERGEITAEEAARIIGRPCGCGVYNPTRAAKLLGEG